MSRGEESPISEKTDADSVVFESTISINYLYVFAFRGRTVRSPFMPVLVTHARTVAPAT